eukprot:362209-Chlamydomonas_euryale.AAC.5
MHSHGVPSLPCGMSPRGRTPALAFLKSRRPRRRPAGLRASERSATHGMSRGPVACPDCGAGARGRHAAAAHVACPRIGVRMGRLLRRRLDASRSLWAAARGEHAGPSPGARSVRAPPRRLLPSLQAHTPAAPPVSRPAQGLLKSSLPFL